MPGHATKQVEEVPSQPLLTYLSLQCRVNIENNWTEERSEKTAEKGGNLKDEKVNEKERENNVLKKEEKRTSEK
jgi:hypothetical protein